MENKKKSASMVLAGLKFSPSEIGEVAENEKNTIPAILLISFSVLLGVVIAFFKGNGGSSGLGRMGITGSNAAIAQMGSLLIGTFLSAFVMLYVIRIFKVRPSFSGILRVYGSAIIWTILKSIIVLIIPLFLPPKFAMIGVVFWFTFNFSVLFGLVGYTKIKIWQSFLSIVITFAIIFGLMVPYGMLIKALFA